MMKKFILALIIPILGIGTYFILGVIMPVAEPTTGIAMQFTDEYETISGYLQDPGLEPVIITSDNHYLSMNVENINITANTTNIEKKGGD